MKEEIKQRTRSMCSTVMFVLQSGVMNSMCRLSQLTVFLSLMVITRGKQKHMPVCVMTYTLVVVIRNISKE